MLEILHNLTRRKLRSVLTISGIVIGIFALTTMGALSEHFSSLLNGGVQYFGSSIQVGPPAGQQTALLPLSSMDAIKHVKGVEVVAPKYQVEAKPSGSSGSEFGPGSAIINEGPRGRNALVMTVGSGRDLTPNSRGEVVLGVTLANDLHKKAGDTVALPVKPAGAPATFANHQFKVVGILDKTGTAPDSFGYVSDADGRMLAADSLPAAVRSAVDVNNVAQGFTVYANRGSSLAQLDAIARNINQQVPAVKAIEPSGPVNNFKSVNTTFTAIVTGAALLALVIGGLSVVNTMIMAVSERTREIGLKKAVGAHTSRILREYIVEASFIGLIGGVVGFAIGAAVTSVVNMVGAASNFDIFLITPRLPVLAIGFAVVLGAVAGVIPAFSAARLDPVSALRNSN